MNRDGTRGDEKLGRFDQFADAASELAGRAPFFAACVLLVLLWGPSYFVFGKINTWQLIINTITTIVTFLLVALLQNTQRRGEIALHKKLNALARALADLMETQKQHDPTLDEDIARMKASVGLEEHTAAADSSRWRRPAPAADTRRTSVG
jgi:low affinity Fe/Cu permease